MKRREFITLLGGAAAAWPLAARAQQPRVPIIGFLRSTTAAGSAHLMAAFRQGLSEAGFVDGQTVAVEYRFADDRADRLPGLAAELVARQVALIVGNTAAVVRAAKTVTATTPIVFVTGSDPVKTGLVASLNRPGGNITGVTFTTIDLAAKQLGLLHELVPGTSVIAVLRDPNGPEPEAELSAVEDAGRAIGRQVLIVKAASEREFAGAFATIRQSGAGALLVRGGLVFLSQRGQLVALAIRHGLPASYVTRDYADVGGLMSYGASQTDAYRRAGIYAVRILKGAKPGELPIDLPTKFELIINLATAKAFGLEIPPMLLARADEVIE
jgi:putative ABC transport system substrate-binding protein